MANINDLTRDACGPHLSVTGARGQTTVNVFCPLCNNIIHLDRMYLHNLGSVRIKFSRNLQRLRNSIFSRKKDYSVFATPSLAFSFYLLIFCFTIVFYSFDLWNAPAFIVYSRHNTNNRDNDDDNDDDDKQFCTKTMTHRYHLRYGARARDQNENSYFCGNM